MNWADLCGHLRKRGIRIGRLEGGCWYLEPRGRMGAALEAGVAEHRDDLEAILEDKPIASLLRHGWVVVAIIPDPPDTAAEVTA